MVTSCFQGTKNLSSKQAPIRFKMATLSIASLFSFFSEEKKSIKKGEHHFKSDHIEAFTYQQGVLRGDVHASVKRKVYKVTVSCYSLHHRSFTSSILPKRTFLFAKLNAINLDDLFG